MSALTIKEIKDYENLHNENSLDINKKIKDLIIYGNYPEVYTDKDNRKDILKGFVNSNLYKDVLEYRGIKKPLILVDLLKLLAYQIGNEVSYTEIAGVLKIDKVTVENYITLLEQAFIIFRLRPYSVNQRNDIKRLRKIYFWDTGIRNAIIGDFSSLEKREDRGLLFENYFISELKKKYTVDKNDNELYFWRSKRGNEIDLLEIDSENKSIIAYECKYKKENANLPKEWSDNFGQTEFNIVNLDNMYRFLL